MMTHHRSVEEDNPFSRAALDFEHRVRLGRITLLVGPTQASSALPQPCYLGTVTEYGEALW